jgi:hypothetical protein
MADITKAVSANDIKNGTSVTGVDGTGNVQAHFEAGKDSTSPSLSDIENKYSSRFDDIKYYFFQEDNPLAIGLVSYYTMDEESGLRDDAVNGKDLTDNNTVGYSSGVSGGLTGTGNAANFIRANSEYLSIDDAALNGLSPGDTDWSISCWLKLNAGPFSNNQHIFGVWKTSPTNSREYLLYWKAGHTMLRFYTSEDGSTETYMNAGSTLSADTWYHVVICHDATNDLKLMYIDGALSRSTSHTTGVYQGDASLNIGRTHNTSNYVDGAIDEWGLWSRVLTSDEVSELYNSGDGIQVISS